MNRKQKTYEIKCWYEQHLLSYLHANSTSPADAVSTIRQIIGDFRIGSYEQYALQYLLNDWDIDLNELINECRMLWGEEKRLQKVTV